LKIAGSIKTYINEVEVSKMKSMVIITALSLFSSAAYAYDKIYLKRLLEENQCHHCNLSEAPLEDHDLEGADMSEANLKGIILTNANVKGAWFTHSRMQGAQLEGADLSNSLMDYAQLMDANLKNAKLDGAHLIFSDMSGADLTGASMKGVHDRGIKFCNTTMPDGSVNNDGC
tara:strand:- start:388 stop:906 length:519 start_codon:yes stop_codon:yes gene_type:complete